MNKTLLVVNDVQITIEHLKGQPPIKIWTDHSVKYSKNELQDLSENQQKEYEEFLAYQKSKVNKRAKSKIVNHIKEKIDTSIPHYLITWTYGNHGFGNNSYEVERDIGNIKSRINKLFYPNFNFKRGRLPRDYSRKYFFKEKSQSNPNQYHIHLLMESIEPEIFAKSLDRSSFLLRHTTIRRKINKRPLSQRYVISSEMLKRYPDYENHAYHGKTFDQLSIYDNWMTARFLCEYMTHYQGDERWGMKKLSNSPRNIHSKVIESDCELTGKIDYLNKDRYYLGDLDFLGHLVPEHSDY